ncbi:MAG: trypsin-like peptidase domain-containing protein [Prolixibacteraceae bacterium]|nr:trypsin-like peptidase domain-containing protein [Prolixibacteraceae bacterium]
MKIIKPIILIILTILSTQLLAQISEGGRPVSHQHILKSAQKIPTIKFAPINTNSLLTEDYNYGTPFRYGIVRDTSINLKSGSKTVLETGTIWQTKLSSVNAKSIKLLFSEYTVPEGAKLFLYNNDYSLISGAFTQSNMNPDSSFAIADFPDNELIVEYFEPANPEFSGSLIINQVSLAYRDLHEMISGEELSASYNDVNCGKGLEWQLEKHAVSKYTFVEDGSSYTCSGALINNTKSDGTPYFLTAHHCVSTNESAKTITAYFNYESSGCGLNTADNFKTLSGAQLLTTGTESDFTLVEFDEIPPASYQPYYAGWDRGNSPLLAVSIHHPEGFFKKISFEDDKPVSYSSQIGWDNNITSPAHSHWEVIFESGMTGSGSSGSPLFNESKRIIGQLHGGGDYDSYYGKIDYSWKNSGVGGRFRDNITYKELWVYLSGQDSTQYINGYTPHDNLPEAVMNIEYDNVCVGAPIQLNDYSVFNVNKWHWDISPANVSFIEGTSPNSQNPIIRFNEPGTYSIKLEVENPYGKDSITYDDAITAGSVINVSYISSPETGTCFLETDSVQIIASGASDYQWELNEGTFDFFNISTMGNKAIIKQNNSTSIDSTFNIEGTIIGQQGTCSDTSFFNIQLVMPTNDDIANATQLNTGENGPFNNICASVETNEPVPPVNSCTSQTDWCDEYWTGENIVENSVWFTFLAPESGAVSIAATGMDGQIALYEANSYTAILNGRYTLLAANDDVSDTDYTSYIETVNVNPGEMYWLQFDGSGGGTEGNFNITLNEENRTSSNRITKNADIHTLNIFPQPAQHYIIAQSSIFENKNNVRVKIYNNTGALIFTERMSANNNQVLIDFDQKWNNGVYYLSAGVY